VPTTFFAHTAETRPFDSAAYIRYPEAGKQARNKAVVGVARKLAVLLIPSGLPEVDFAISDKAGCNSMVRHLPNLIL
jgi:hypothetical protein